MKSSLLSLVLTSILMSAPAFADNVQATNTVSQLAPAAQLPVVEAELTIAPNVPKPIERKTPAKVVVKLEALEKVMNIDQGAENPEIYTGKIKQENYDKRNPDADIDAGFSH